MAGMFYQAVVVVVLLCGRKLWVLLSSRMWVLEGFHIEAARWMTGLQPQQRTVGPWICPKSADVLAAARLKSGTTYIARHRHRISKTIDSRAW
jgi:hypothetical protein